ncbi:hypothetical protein SFC52_15775 [Niallia circulans]|jgi:hypothetical protein|nr:hypothetical protein [Niallia circulans]
MANFNDSYNETLCANVLAAGSFVISELNRKALMEKIKKRSLRKE